MTTLEEYYNKFNEEKRLDSRHGQVEYQVTMEIIHQFLEKQEECTRTLRILDLGAGTGRYAVPLALEGYQVTAVEPVRHNLSRLKQKGAPLCALQGNALNLKKLKDDSFDLTLVFGPLYHLTTEEEQRQALSEAFRVTRPGGIVMAAYVMNEYAILIHGFRDHKILESIEDGSVDESFRVQRWDRDLYRVMRLEDIDALAAAVGGERRMIFSPDGPANHMRRELNALSEAEFSAFLRYQKSVCARPELLGAGGHIVDVLEKK